MLENSLCFGQSDYAVVVRRSVDGGGGNYVQEKSIIPVGEDGTCDV